MADSPGHANAVAVELDRVAIPGVLRTIAGDDTIFVAVRSDRQAQALLDRLRSRPGA